MPLQRFLDGLVHGSVADDDLASTRHRSFIAAHLAAGLAALAAFPLWLALIGPVPLAAAIAFALLAAPLPVAAFLSRTGRYGEAHLFSVIALTALVVWVAALTGGALSPALVWLAIVPAEAALSGSSRVTGSAVGIAAAGLAAVLFLSASALLPVPLATPPAFGPILIAAALLYAGALAFRVDAVHRETERAARSGETRYRLLADNVSDLITAHAPNGDVAFASPAARTLLGAAPAELFGHGLFNRVHIADRPAFLTAISEADRTGGSVSVEFRIRRSDPAAGAAPPDFIWAEMRCRPVSEPGNGRRSVVGVTRDVTERKAQEVAFAEARAAAEEASDAKTQFLATMSHELRTPLNAIIGFSDILSQELFGRLESERQRDYARLIHSSGEHLLQVVNSILDMSRIEAGKVELEREAFALQPLIESCAEMVSQQASGRGVRIVRRIDAGLPELLADRRACRQIVLNLLSNAIKFTDAGGTVTVSARVEHDRMVLSVADNGIGIAPKDLPRLGQPFVQAESAYDRRFEGTGLGLSVVKGLVGLHGGTVGIESELGAGTTVSVRFPLHGSARTIETEPAFETRERRRA